MMLRLDANNDNSGNPRRIYVAIGPGGAIEGAWDEGYSGRQAVPEKYRSHAYNAVHINITPAEYRTWRKIADKQFGAKPKAAKRVAKPKAAKSARLDKQYKGDLFGLNLGRR